MNFKKNLIFQFYYQSNNTFNKNYKYNKKNIKNYILLSIYYTYDRNCYILKFDFLNFE